MKEYHKIQTIYKRDMEAEGRKKPLIEGDWTKPEFMYLSSLDWIGTEKIDGTNIRVMWSAHIRSSEPQYNVNKLEFRGKTDKAQLPPLLLKRLQEIFTEDKMKEAFDLNEVCLYGEGFGGKIQGRKEYGDYDFILFDIKVGHWWLERDALIDIALKFGIKVVPTIFLGSLFAAVDMVKKGFESTVSERPLMAEGLILQPKIQLFNRKGERIITKIKYEDFK